MHTIQTLSQQQQMQQINPRANSHDLQQERSAVDRVKQAIAQNPANNPAEYLLQKDQKPIQVASGPRKVRRHIANPVGSQQYDSFKRQVLLEANNRQGVKQVNLSSSIQGADEEARVINKSIRGNSAKGASQKYSHAKSLHQTQKIVHVQGGISRNARPLDNLVASFTTGNKNPLANSSFMQPNGNFSSTFTMGEVNQKASRFKRTGTTAPNKTHDDKQLNSSLQPTGSRKQLRKTSATRQSGEKKRSTENLLTEKGLQEKPKATKPQEKSNQVSSQVQKPQVVRAYISPLNGKQQQAESKPKSQGRLIRTTNTSDIASGNAFVVARDTLQKATSQLKAKLIVEPKRTEVDLGIDQSQKNEKDSQDIVIYRGMKMTYEQSEEYKQMENDQINRFKANYYAAKFASKKNGVVVTYSANTHQGMVRNYNEDRVSIILNIIKPKFKTIDYWPRCSFFAIYDGHGGQACADFLRDQLHQMIVKDVDFPTNPKDSIRRATMAAEKQFLNLAHNESNHITGEVQRSGSCAIIVLIISETVYIANIGDSRAIMSIDGGKHIKVLSTDHKPEDDSERARIEGNGGKVYQNQSFIPDPSPDNPTGTQSLNGPHRVQPGRLSVSRTIGDIEAKDKRYGGNPDVVISTPDIISFKIKSNYDFIVLGCDGVFEKQSNQDIVRNVWQAYSPDTKKALVNTDTGMTLHTKAGDSIDRILHGCVEEKTLDNVTAVMIGFKNMEELTEKGYRTPKTESIPESLMESENVEEELEKVANQQKLMKPLDVVAEEEASEVETPADTPHAKKKKQEQAEISIMSSRRNSNSDGVALEETTRPALGGTVVRPGSRENKEVVILKPHMDQAQGQTRYQEDQGGAAVRASTDERPPSSTYHKTTAQSQEQAEYKSSLLSPGTTSVENIPVTASQQFSKKTSQNLRKAFDVPTAIIPNTYLNQKLGLEKANTMPTVPIKLEKTSDMPAYYLQQTSDVADKVRSRNPAQNNFLGPSLSAGAGQQRQLKPVKAHVLKQEDIKTYVSLQSKPNTDQSQFYSTQPQISKQGWVGTEYNNAVKTFVQKREQPNLPASSSSGQIGSSLNKNQPEETKISQERAASAQHRTSTTQHHATFRARKRSSTKIASDQIVLNAKPASQSSKSRQGGNARSSGSNREGQALMGGNSRNMPPNLKHAYTAQFSMVGKNGKFEI